MNHYVSVSIDSGRAAVDAIRVPLNDLVSSFPTIARLNKEDNTLLFGVYLDLPDNYDRKGLESHPGARINTLFIDCDNGIHDKPETWDKDIMVKFKEDMKDFNYIIWETYSSTTARPKFRALIPLDKTIKYNKCVKRAVYHMFKDYADSNATWYFAPDIRHLDTVDLHLSDGFKLFESSAIEHIASQLQEEENQRNAINWSFQIHQASRGIKHNPEGWRNLPSVKKCLEGLHVGERDSSLNAACYAMKQYGYKDNIPEFLDEVICDNEIKRKFRNRYR